MEFAWDALTQAVMHGGCTSSLMDHHWVNLVTNVAAEAEASLGNGAVASPDTAPVSDGSLGGSAEFNEESTSPQATSQTPSVRDREDVDGDPYVGLHHDNEHDDEATTGQNTGPDAQGTAADSDRDVVEASTCLRTLPLEIGILIALYLQDFDEDPDNPNEKGTMPQAARSCAVLRNAINPLLFWSIEQNIDPHPDPEQEAITVRNLPAMLAQANIHTRHLTIMNKKTVTDQEVLKLVLRTLRRAKLETLWFDKVVIDEANEMILHDALSGDSSTLYRSLRRLNLPLCQQQDRDGVANCTAEFKFHATNLPNEQIVDIEVTGNLARGSPVLLLPGLMRKLSFGRGFEKVLIKGADLSCRTDNVFAWTELDPQAANRYKIRDLEFQNIHFRDALHPSILERIDASSIERLTLKECDAIELLFRFLMQSNKPLQLKSFFLTNWILEGQFDKKDPTSIEALFNYFTGLQECAIILSTFWPLDLKTMFANHKTMSSLTLNLGDRDINVTMLSKILVLCPNLTTLAFRHRVFELPYKESTFERQLCGTTGYADKGFDAELLPIADKARRVYSRLRMLELKCVLVDKPLHD